MILPEPPSRFWNSVAAFIIFIVVVVVAAAWAMAKLRRGPDSSAWPFHAKKPLSVPEQALFFRLQKALPEHVVVAQVALSRMLGLKKGYDFRSRFNRIDRMPVDFAVCAKDLSVLAAIELDDSTHRRPERMQADSKNERALAAAGITLVRFQAGRLPDEAAIRSALEARTEHKKPGKA